MNGEIPECSQGYAGGKDRDDDEGIVDHDDGQEDERGTTDPCKSPNASIKEEDGHLRQPEAKFVEEECVPADLEKGISGMNDVVGDLDSCTIAKSRRFSGEINCTCEPMPKVAAARGRVSEKNGRERLAKVLKASWLKNVPRTKVTVIAMEKICATVRAAGAPLDNRVPRNT